MLTNPCQTIDGNADGIQIFRHFFKHPVYLSVAYPLTAHNVFLGREFWHKATSPCADGEEGGGCSDIEAPIGNGGGGVDGLFEVVDFQQFPFAAGFEDGGFTLFAEEEQLAGGGAGGRGVPGTMNMWSWLKPFKGASPRR